MNETKKKIFLAAGGTAGHLFPAEALGEELIAMNYDVRLVTDKRGARFKGALKNIPVYSLYAATFKSGLLNKLNAAFKLGLGFLQSIHLLFKHKPDLIVGFGGYPSLPIVFTAQLLGFETMIHDQNGVLGAANAFLAKRAKIIATSLPIVLGIRESDKGKVIMTGSPVRPAIIHQRFTPYQQPSKDTDFNLFVVGGSQGAKVFSRVVPDAVALLPKELQGKLKITQQCRLDDVADTQKKYADMGVKATVSHFYENIAEIIASAHLIIGRSGASTVSEIATIGRPAIFVPLHHADKQQYINAQALTDHGAGWVMVENGFTPEALCAQLETLMQLPEKLAEVANKAKECGRPSAAKELAKVVKEKIEKDNEAKKIAT